MAQNFDGQYEIRIIYDTTPTGFTIMEHVLTFDVLPTATPAVGEAFSGIEVSVRGGGSDQLDAAIDTFVAGMIGIYPATTSIIRAELWYIPEGTFAGTFISAYGIDEVGTNATASQPSFQATYTFRSLGGGYGRIQFMESSIASNSRLSYPYANAAQNAIPDLITGSGNFIIARDNTFMFANIHLSVGQNERLFRKRYRS